MKLSKYISKKLLNNKILKNILSWLAYQYIRVAYYSTNWEIIKPNNLNINDLYKKPIIYAFWHGRLMMMSPYLGPTCTRANVLSSGHRDGDLMSNITKHFNFNTIYGTSKKNSIAATRELIRKLKKGESIAITPDGGRRGPRMHIKSNIITIARLAQTPIIPVSFSTTKCHIFSSWDKFIFTLPFGKGYIIYGNKMTIPKDADAQEEEKFRNMLEKELNEISYKADSLAGIEPIMPA